MFIVKEKNKKKRMKRKYSIKEGDLERYEIKNIYWF